MEPKLSEGENIIKRWCFAQDNTSSGKTENTLIVTDRRLISSEVSFNSIKYNEIGLNSIKSVSSSYSSNKVEKTKNNPLFIGIAIAFLVAAVLSLIFVTMAQVLLIVGISLIVLSIVFFCLSTTNRTELVSASFSIIIKTHGQEGSNFVVGKSAGENDTQKFTINSISFNERIIIDIINTIGAVAINRIPPIETEQIEQSNTKQKNNNETIELNNEKDNQI